MPRHARFLLPDVPHHVTQRGNHRESVFFCRGDHFAYLRLLREHSQQHSIEVVAYCLMPNHVHLVLVPSGAEQLHRVLRAVHGQYAQRINRMTRQKGHLWQGRYFSSPLDSDYFLNAVRYVELNPVRAGLVGKAEEYCWSSAAAHCGLGDDSLVGSKPKSALFAKIASWSRWLSEGIADKSLTALRRNCSQNLPCGSSEFVAQLEKVVGRPLQYKPAGRQPRKQDRHS